MQVSVLKSICFTFFLGACASSSTNRTQTSNTVPVEAAIAEQPVIDSANKPRSMMDLPQTQFGGFVLAPGFYEAEFKTYCLQPGTPDPRKGDAYLQGPVTGYRKEIVEDVLLNSQYHPRIDQRNVQLLLWSVVSGSNFNKLSYEVKADAMKLLTPKQVFELKGGVVGAIKTVSAATGILNANSDLQRLFEVGTASYEAYEKMAVLKEPSQVRRTGVKYDQWYKQPGNYYVRYFPESYKKVRIQVYVPDGLLDSSNRVGNDYLVFDPTGQQASPAFTNAQKLGIGAPVADIVRVIIQVNKEIHRPDRIPEKKKKVPAKGKPLPTT